MRYLTVDIHPADGAVFHPLGAKLAREPALSREALHHVEYLSDGTVLLLAEGSGDQERYREIMADAPSVVDFLVSGGDPWMAVSQFEPSETVQRFLELRRETDIVTTPPLEFTDDGALRVTLVGSDDAIQSLYHMLNDDDAFDLDVRETGDYDPNQHTLGRLLTDRQRDVLEAAVDVGYYAEPRQATLADVAAKVGIAQSTAGEHLRRVESRVFEAIVN